MPNVFPSDILRRLRAIEALLGIGGAGEFAGAFLLAGRPGGQIAHGGTDSADSLTLVSSAAGGSGDIKLVTDGTERARISAAGALTLGTPGWGEQAFLGIRSYAAGAEAYLDNPGATYHTSTLPLTTGTGLIVAVDTGGTGPLGHGINAISADLAVQAGDGQAAQYNAVSAWLEVWDGVTNLSGVGFQANAFGWDSGDYSLWGTTLGVHIQPNVINNPPLGIGAEFDMTDMSSRTGTGNNSTRWGLPNAGVAADVVAHGYNDFVHGVRIRGDSGPVPAYITPTKVSGGTEYQPRGGGNTSTFLSAITIPTTGKVYPAWSLVHAITGVDLPYEVGACVTWSVASGGDDQQYKCVQRHNGGADGHLPSDTAYWAPWVPTRDWQGPREYAFYFGPTGVSGGIAGRPLGTGSPRVEITAGGDVYVSGNLTVDGAIGGGGDTNVLTLDGIFNPISAVSGVVGTKKLNASATLALNRAEGTGGTAVASGDVLGNFLGRGYNSGDAGWVGGALMRAVAYDDFTVAGNGGTRLDFLTTPAGSTVPEVALTIAVDKTATFRGDALVGDIANLTTQKRLCVMSVTSGSTAVVAAGGASVFHFTDVGVAIQDVAPGTHFTPGTTIAAVADSTHATLSDAALNTAGSAVASIGVFGGNPLSTALFTLPHQYPLATSGLFVGHRVAIRNGASNTDPFPTVARLTEVDHYFDDTVNSQGDVAAPGPRGLDQWEGTIVFGPHCQRRDTAGGPWLNNQLTYTNETGTTTAPGGLITGATVSCLVAPTGGTFSIYANQVHWSNVLYTSTSGTLRIGEHISYMNADIFTLNGGTAVDAGRWCGFFAGGPNVSGGATLYRSIGVDIGELGPQNFTVTATNGSAVVTGSGPFGPDDKGAFVTIAAPHAAGDLFIVSVDSTTQVTLSAPLTISGGGSASVTMGMQKAQRDPYTHATVNIGLRNASTTVYSPDSQTIATGGEISPIATLVQITTSGGAVTLANPNITIDNTQDGQILEVLNLGPDNVVFTNGQGVDLRGHATLTLGDNDSVRFRLTRSAFFPFVRWQMERSTAASSGVGSFSYITVGTPLSPSGTAASFQGSLSVESGFLGLDFIATEFNGGQAALDLRSTRGSSLTSPSASLSGDNLGKIHIGGGTPSGLVDCAYLACVANQTFSGSQSGTRWEFYTTPNGTNTRTLAATVGNDGSFTAANTIAAGGQILSDNAVFGSCFIGQSYTSTANLGLYHAGGSKASPTATTSGTAIGRLAFGGYQTTTSAYVIGASIRGVAGQDFTSTHAQTKLEFYTTPVNSITNTLALTLASDQSATFAGNVTISGNLTVTGTGGGGASSPLTTKGDIWTYSTVDARLAVGTSGYVLRANSGATTGLSYAPALLLDGTVNTATNATTEIQSSGTGAQTFRLSRDKGGTAIANNDVTFTLAFRANGDTSSTMGVLAQVAVLADTTNSATISSTSTPGKMMFYTTASGALTSTVRLIIDNAGAVFFGATAAGALASIDQTGLVTAQTVNIGGSTASFGDNATPTALITYTSTATNDDPTVTKTLHRETTTAAVTINFLSLAIATSYTTNFLIHVWARRTGGGGGSVGDSLHWIAAAAFKNVAGTVTQVGSTTPIHAVRSNASVGFPSLVISGTQVEVQCTGIALNNYVWHCEIEHRTLST